MLWIAVLFCTYNISCAYLSKADFEENFRYFPAIIPGKSQISVSLHRTIYYFISNSFRNNPRSTLLIHIYMKWHFQSGLL